MNTLMKLIAVILFGEQTITGILRECLYYSGLWFLFKKCGVPSWTCLIPAYRDYQLARCADREPEGRVLFVSKAVLYIIGIVSVFEPKGTLFDALFATLTISFYLIAFAYKIRVGLGLCEVFGRKKRWTVLWLFFTGFMTPLWGLHPKFLPQWKVPDFQNEKDEFFAPRKAAVLENGLTVNLTERTAREFLKKKTLLRNISMDIRPGSMVLLLGGSGAGKTTLLNAVIGYEKANAEILLNGRNIYHDYKSMQYEIGFVPQQDLMRGSDTVLHTLLDAAALRLPTSFSPGERKTRVDEVMKTFGLGMLASTHVDKLSGGQRKRLSIAMEFISNPTLFILDEPDSGLDGVMARELMQALRRIADQGKIVIVITHTPDRVIDLFDDVIVLAKDAHRTGRLAFYGSIAEARAFFGRDSMEGIVRAVNRSEEGGDGQADNFIRKYAEVCHD